ncbi:MAG TPA: adenosylmethionine--8-amino-7-oxononanoate transaminase [Verrucomicrobiales bacterium]|nr:adenosylmethionine--8-amino-7-oxononanoate transaminase [Verrucomicrobiales bacterium]
MEPHPTAHPLQRLDKTRLWHPFTPMRDWCADDHQPLILTKGRGAWLEDFQGNRYLDGNSSIWTNIHGHSHPHIVAAIQRQAASLAHCSFLGSTNEPAIRLAVALVDRFPQDTLTRVFYSDDGSTAIECALRLALQFRQHTGAARRNRFLVFDQAYHGDTLGAACLGGLPLFHEPVRNLGYPLTRIASLDELQSLPAEIRDSATAVVLEPLIQGAAGMRLWPPGMLGALRTWCDRHDVLLILDEVLTGFGRTGTLFACQKESVVPDLMALAKGLTGGTVPLAATLVTERIFSAFLGTGPEPLTFFYGHSYTGNPLGCAAARASLEIFEMEKTLERLPRLIQCLETSLEDWRQRSSHISAVRQCGLIAGIDITRDGSPNNPFPPEARMGAQICLAARSHGLLTRPIGDTLILMPPLCVTEPEIRAAVHALEEAAQEVSSNGSRLRRLGLTK